MGVLERGFRVRRRKKDGHRYVRIHAEWSRQQFADAQCSFRIDDKPTCDDLVRCRLSCSIVGRTAKLSSRTSKRHDYHQDGSPPFALESRPNLHLYDTKHINTIRPMTRYCCEQIDCDGLAILSNCTKGEVEAIRH